MMQPPNAHSSAGHYSRQWSLIRYIAVGLLGHAAMTAAYLLAEIWP